MSFRGNQVDPLSVTCARRTNVIGRWYNRRADKKADLPICKQPHLCASFLADRRKADMTVLGGFRVVQFGRGLAAAVCGRILADIGAEVARIDPDRSTPLAEFLNHGPSASGAPQPVDLIVCEGSPASL